MAQLKQNFPAQFFEPESKELIVSSKAKQMWAVLLDLLLEFKRVCGKHGIKWSIDGGTMLGARRHGGFIPWDDDVDVIMLRSEYEKLRKVAKDEFTYPYFLQNNDTDPECVRGHAQFRNSSTTAILKSEWDGSHAKYRFNQGVFMDVFVLDNVPDNEAERRAFCEKLDHIKSMMWRLRDAASYRVTLRGLMSPRGIKMIVEKAKLRIREILCGGGYIQRLGDELERVAQTYNSVPCREVSHVTFKPIPKPRVVFRRDKLEEIVTVQFAGFDMPCLKESDYYLTNLYGNWNEHVVGGSCHGGLIIDLDKSYKEYLR